MTSLLPPQWQTNDQGGLTAFVVPFVVGLLVLAGLALDGGLALAAKAEANGQAEAAARAGAQAIDLADYRTSNRLRLVPTQAVAKAQSYLTSVEASDIVTVTITTSHTTQLLGLVGISSLSVRGAASAHPQHEVATGP